MKQLDDLITALRVPTNQLSSQQIQEVLLETKRVQNSELNQTNWFDVLELLWHHIQSGLNKFDDQLLCATCFYSVLTHANKQELYLGKILQIISDELHLKEHNKQSSHTVMAISLMYGIFQSSYLTKKEDLSNIETILQAIFKLLILLGYEYSKFTFITFKILNFFKKICGIKRLREIVFCKENQIILLNLTNHNWENPITGVRDLNKDIFRNLISMLDKDVYDIISEEVNTFYWNKAKYLMLAEIIEHNKCQKYNSGHIDHWVDGYIKSLHKPGLVSAGTDMYHSMLNKLKTEKDWCEIFQKNIMNLFNGSSAKAIENFSNYCCLTTLKRFPSLYKIFLDELDNSGDLEHKLLSTLQMIKQANKLGLLAKNWENRTNIEETVLKSLNHCQSQIRVLAFEIICISHSKSMPTKLEYEQIIKFLHDNVNSDCTVLRISMLNNFGAFLTQMHINFINNGKKRDKVAEDDLYDFYNKVQELIISCLNVNGNYQRKITVIKIAKLFMRNLAEVPNKRKKQTQANITMIEILKGKELLIILEDDFIAKLVGLLNDHSEDIRANVIELLLDNYSEQIHKEAFINSLTKSASKDVGSKYFYDINCGHSKFKLISSILLKNQSQGIFKGLQDLLEFAWTEFVSEYKLKRGVVESIEKGKQLHSLIAILQVVLEVCYKNSDGFKIPESCNLIECLDALDDISNQFSWKENNTTSSDFSKMSDMVESLINDSDFKSRSGNDQTKISGLHQIVLNCLWLNVKIPESCNLIECLDALDDISNQFSWKENNTTSSDFSKMSDMVESLINDSDFKSRSGNDQTKISGLHQIVLNCLWLNVKASCDLSSLIIQYLKEETYTAMVEKCLGIITRVLETCRHKGAIEAAGVCLGQAIRYLTCNPEDNSLSRLPLDLLKCKLNELISEASNMASVTRRGAGLSIMVHKIVSNDMKKGKPLFHYFMKTLLETCNMAMDFPVGLKDNTENERDLPQAIYIHFLTKIVHDSSLASDMMFYSAELAELAFGNLTSPHWQIRNAALQLYGALVPKLIGQKKQSGTDDETVATVACDEFRTHSPKLWNYILRELKQGNLEEKIQKHYNLIPILNMLANMARRYTFSYDHTEKDDLETLESLISLLDSPIYTARRLTAKCVFNMYSLRTLTSAIIKQDKFTENSLHGCIILTSFYHKLLERNSTQEDDFKILGLKFRNILSTGNHSYLCKAMFEDIRSNCHLKIDLSRTFKEVDDSLNAPGICVWANGQVKKHFDETSEEDIPQSLELILDRNDFELNGEMLLRRIKNDRSLKLNKDILIKVANILMNCESKWNNCVTWMILYHISKKVDLCKHINILRLVIYLEEKKYPYKLRYSIPFMAKICTSHEDGNTICIVVHSLTDAETNDVDMRYIAVLALNELSERFCDLSDKAKCYVLISAIKLLQDEDEDIRNGVVRLYKNLSNCLIAPHPYICLMEILDIKFLENHLPVLEIEELCNQLIDYCHANCNFSSTDDYNPFANDSKNIYLEIDILKQLIGNVRGYLN